jgi:hypothetical protein
MAIDHDGRADTARPAERAQARLRRPVRLCDADQGTITRQRDGLFYRAESYGFSPEFSEL